MQESFAANLISPAAADRLIAAHDGDLALLFIFMQRTGSADLEMAAGQLCRTRAEMEAAFEKLQRMGLVAEGQSCALAGRQIPPAAKLPPADELPEYRAEDITRHVEEDGAFFAVLKEAETVMGHKLSTPDLKKLFGIYKHLALPAEVIMELLHFCMYKSMGEDGMGRPPSMRFIEREAYNWLNLEILSLEQAEEYISRSKQRKEMSSRVAGELGIRGRALSPSEKKYISSWLDMGFGVDVIALAYDRTVTNTGGLKWSYMNKILSSWREKGLLSLADIEEKEPRRRMEPMRKSVDKPIDFSDLDAMFNDR